MKIENCKFISQERLFYLSFSHFLGIGPIKLAALISYFKSIKKAYEANKYDLEKVIGVKLTQKFIEFRVRFDPVKKYDELKRKDIGFITLIDNEYPADLKQISDPPICLYIRGHLDSADQKIFFSIVGTRNPTQYGIQVARKFSQELTEAGFTIVSGMALGIDAIVHKGALDAGGRTIAVLGCGVDIIYPAANRFLYEKIIENGAVISEFPPGHMVIKGLFIARNRIISALSQGVLVIEGGERSGALITAKYAAEQGKEVFAVPSSINSNMSQAPNILIKQGAKLVTTTSDIFEELNIKIIPKKEENLLSKLTAKEREIYSNLIENSLTIDEIALAINENISITLNILSVMEVNGVIERNSERKYQVKL